MDTHQPAPARKVGGVRFNVPAVVDRVAHALHRAHLIPWSLLQWVCDWYDRSLGLTDDEIRQGMEVAGVNDG
jgi:hypothetical protein